jgi:hypothetical protein
MSATVSPDFDYAPPKLTAQQQQDLEAQAENVINSHMADLDYEEEETLDDDEQVIHYSTNVPKRNEKGEMENEEIVVQRSILPARRRKLLNLRYLTRLRGLVKLAQTVIYKTKILSHTVLFRFGQFCFTLLSNLILIFKIIQRKRSPIICALF